MSIGRKLTICLLALVFLSTPAVTTQALAQEATEVTGDRGVVTRIEDVGVPYPPGETERVAIADSRGVPLSDVDLMAVTCWSYSRRVDETQYWVLLGLNWCWDSVTGYGVNVNYWQQRDVKGPVTTFMSFNGSAGPYYPGDGVTIARADGQWHFRSSVGIGPDVNYYPYIAIIGNNRGSVIVDIHT